MPPVESLGFDSDFSAFLRANVEEIRVQLRKEGYSNVDGHLMGRKIRSDLVKLIRKTG